jgi:DNA-directed RNA polymerase specialized sigma24 family protein
VSADEINLADQVARHAYAKWKPARLQFEDLKAEARAKLVGLAPSVARDTGYLYATILNHLRDHVRAQARAWGNMGSVEALPETDEPRGDLEECSELAGTDKALTGQERAAITAIREGLTQVQAARSMGISRAQFGRLIQSATMRLRELNEQFHQGYPYNQVDREAA